MKSPWLILSYYEQNASTSNAEDDSCDDVEDLGSDIEDDSKDAEYLGSDIKAPLCRIVSEDIIKRLKNNTVFIIWKAYSARDLNIMTDEDQKVIDTHEAQLKAGRETQRTIPANVDAGNEEAKGWVGNRNLSVSSGKLEATKARREARGGTVV